MSLAIQWIRTRFLRNSSNFLILSFTTAPPRRNPSEVCCTAFYADLTAPKQANTHRRMTHDKTLEYAFAFCIAFINHNVSFEIKETWPMNSGSVFQDNDLFQSSFATSANAWASPKPASFSLCNHSLQGIKVGIQQRQSSHTSHPHDICSSSLPHPLPRN